MMVGLHSFWDTVLEPLARALRTREIVVVGGDNRALVRDLLSLGDTVSVLCPSDDLDVDALRTEFGERFVACSGMSIAALSDDAEIDLLLLDGDPNWFAVRRELRLVEERALAQRREPPAIVVHR